MRQDKWLRWSVAVFALALLGWFVVDHTTLIDAWTVNGGPASLSQVHAWCSANDPVIFGSTSVSVCHSVTKWQTLEGGLQLLALVTLVATGFRVYRNVFHPARAQQQRGY